MTGPPVTEATMLRCRWAAAPFAGPGVDRELDDLAQEAAIGALEARREWCPERGPFPPFEFVRMRSRVQRAVRDSARLKRGGGLSAAPLPQTLAGGEPTDSVIAVHELLADVRRLPVPQQRTIVCVAAGLTQAEVAEREGVTGDAIWRRVREARARLKLAA